MKPKILLLITTVLTTALVTLPLCQADARNLGGLLRGRQPRPQPTPVPVQPPPQQRPGFGGSPQAPLQIDLVSSRYGGPGCRPGSAEISMAPDNATFSILYSGMQVETANNRLHEYKGCSVDVDLRIPVGYQLELTGVDYRGYMNLQGTDSYANVNSHHYFEGGSVEWATGQRQPGGTMVGGLTTAQRGPFEGDLTWRAEYQSGGRFMKAITLCDGNARLRIDSKVTASIASPENSAFLSLDSADGTFQRTSLAQTYHLALVPCDAANRRRERVCRQGTCHTYYPRRYFND